MSSSVLDEISHLCVFGRFQLHDHAGEALCESVVDVARQTIALRNDSRLAT